MLILTVELTNVGTQQKAGKVIGAKKKYFEANWFNWQQVSNMIGEQKGICGGRVF